LAEYHNGAFLHHTINDAIREWFPPIDRWRVEWSQYHRHALLTVEIEGEEHHRQVSYDDATRPTALVSCFRDLHRTHILQTELV